MKAKGRKSMRRQAPSHDLLLPVLCVLCVMPFCIHLAEYDYGYSEYLWHSDNSIAQDLYAYYRSYFFEIVSAVSLLVLSLRMALYREAAKPWKIYRPLGIYLAFALLSACFSINQRASFTGNFYQFQSILVLFGFCLMSLYTYQIMGGEQDYRIVAAGITAAFFLISISGWLQVLGHDLLNFPWVQRLVMSGEQFAEYGGTMEDVFTGNNVFLTLYNPNYAAVFLVMCTAVFAALAYGEQEQRKKTWYLLLLCSSLVLLWFTYTRAALVALAVGAVLFLLCQMQNARKSLRLILPGCLLLTALLIGADAWQGFPYLSRLAEARGESKLEEIRTMESGISITCDGKNIVLSVEEGQADGLEVGSAKLSVSDGSGKLFGLARQGETYRLPFSVPAEATLHTETDGPSFTVQIEEFMLEFVKTEDGYFYRNENGKLDELTEIPRINLHGWETLGSGRLYIWSRVIPMLKHYLLLGSGPDTFPEAYPQQDYIGKLQYAGTGRRIIEGAHNDYLTRWVQTGLVSLIGLVAFYVLFFKRCFSYYRNCPLDSTKRQLGFGCCLACACYLVCCLFCDSSLYTTPAFYVFAGIALAAAENT